MLIFAFQDAHSRCGDVAFRLLHLNSSEILYGFLGPGRRVWNQIGPLDRIPKCRDLRHKGIQLGLQYLCIGVLSKDQVIQRNFVKL